MDGRVEEEGGGGGGEGEGVIDVLFGKTWRERGS